MHRRRRRLHHHHQYYPANCCTQSIRHIRYRSLLVHADHRTNAGHSKSRSRYFEIHYCVHYDDFGQVEVHLQKNVRKRCTTSQKRQRKHWETFPYHHHHHHYPHPLLENFSDRLRSKSSSDQTIFIKKQKCEPHEETTVVNDDYYDNVVLRACEREFRVISSVRLKCVNFHKQIFNHNIEMETLRDSKSLKEMNYDYVNCAMETKKSRQCQKIDNISSEINDISDHNRILNQTIAQPTNSTTSVISTTIKNASKIEPTTSEINEITSTSAVVNNFLPDKSDENKRVRSRTSSPLPNNSKFTANSDKKNKQQQHHVHASSSFRTLPLHRLSEDELTLTTYEKEEAEKATPSYNNSLKYQRLETLFREQSQQQNRSIEALAVLLQYLVYDLDAFACPAVKVQNVTAQEKLCKTLILLEETKSACSELQDQLCDKEAYYAQRENELHALHRCELEKTSLQLSEFQLFSKQQISELENQLNAKETEYKRTLDCYRLEMENKLSQKKEQLKAAEDRERSLHQRLTAVERSEQELHQQLTNVQTTCAGRIQMAAEREQVVNERMKLLSKELDQLRAIKENNERELKDKLNLSQDELAVLRTSRRSLNESAVNNSPRNSSSIANMEISRLQSEAESLRCVLELKQKEISKLTKQNEELLRDAEERSSLQNKISLLESKNEMLQSELEIKSDKEKDFLRQMDEIQKAFNHETVKRTRLSYDNEALQWQLKQRSEQLHIVEAKLAELSASNEMMNSSSLGFINRSMLNGSSVTNSTHVEDVSPPSSPVVKGVIEKTDSVSWVLEMDDETPEVAASKLVKRAGSFRSVERSPSTRRQLSVSANAAVCNSNALNNSNNSMIGVGPHPLSQSMSATSVIREHSKEATSEFINRAQSRIRSKSVSVKGTETGQKSTKKLIRQHSGGNTRKIELTANVWKESLVTSSPYTVRPRSSNFKRESSSEHGDQEILFRRSSPSSKLITCDTSSLNSGERLEMRSLPSHPSVHDLKGNKKCQEIQESAGEAMVSGTNSEDESCSASSDDMASSVSTSSAAASDSTSSSSSNQIKNPHISLEEVLLIKKINSLSATPMEVSWSEEGDTFANSSTL